MVPPWTDEKRTAGNAGAQLDRAPDYESGGQEFESLRARHQINSLAEIESFDELLGYT